MKDTQETILPLSEADKVSSGTWSLSKTDNELFDETKAKEKRDVWHFKRKSSKKGDESVEIFLNQELMFEAKMYRFSSKEKEFLNSPQGISFLLSSVKNGLRFVSKLKSLLKDKIGE